MYGGGVSSRRAHFVASARQAPRSLNAAVRGLELAKGEYKSVDKTISANANTCADNAPADLLNGMQLGTDINTCVGREITLRSVQLEGFIQNVTAATNIARVVVVYDRQTNGSAPTWATVFGTASTNTGLQNSRNLDNRKRFKILMDRTLVFEPQNTVGDCHKVEFYRKLRHPTERNGGNAGTVGDISTGGLFFFCVAQTGGTTHLDVHMTSRIRFLDK